jgi:acetylornithine/succinyldiaminopimelate/putrescine aminotransferase
VTFDLRRVLDANQGRQFLLHAEHLNPQLPRVLKTLGFDRFYVSADGCYLVDDQGNRILDMLSGFGVFALGRGDPTVKRALVDAIGLDLPSMIQIDCSLLAGLLAEQLTDRSPRGIERVYFCNSGAEAVEASIKFARTATTRGRILYADHAYHGLTMGALSLNGTDSFRTGFGPFMGETTMVPFGDAEAVASEVAKGDVAAFIVEPIQGKGVYEAPPSYFQEAERVLHDAGALLILDEVQTGLGRTGTFLTCEQLGISPDIITISKALSGGFIPVGAMLATDSVFRSVYSSMDRALVHSTTFKQNPLAMVAGLATLSVMDERGLIGHAAAMEQIWKERLAPLVDRYEHFHEVRGKGQMIGLIFGEPSSARLRAQWRAMEAIRPALFSQTLVIPLFHRHGILTQVAADNANIIKLLPPLIAGEEEVDAVVRALDDVLAHAQKGSGLFMSMSARMTAGAIRRPKKPSAFARSKSADPSS